MPAKFTPLPADEPMLTLPEFLKRVDNEPAFAEKMRAHYESMIAVPASPETDAMRKAAQGALKTLKHRLGVVHAIAKLVEGEQLMDEPEADFDRIYALVEGAVDDLLDVMEPDRTRLMKRVLELQESVRKFKEDTGESP